MSNEIVKQGDTALAPTNTSADEMSALKQLAERLPAQYKGDVLMLKKPEPAELVGIVEKLPAETTTKLMEIIRKTRPKKQGAHTSREGFQPTEIRLYQGTGTDALRPKNCIPGGLYTSESKLLEAPFDAAVIHFYEGRILWPPREGGESAKAPICVSMDRKKGSRYGECSSCPYAGKPYNQGGCMKEVVAFLVDKDFTGIYSMRFNKSSQGAGEALTRILNKSEEIFSRWVRFETSERTEGSKRWFVLKASPVADAKSKANEYVQDELKPLFNAFSRIIDRDVYWPGMADVYTRLEGSTDANTGEAGATGESFDEKALGAGEETKAGGESPDFSGSM